MTAGVSLVKTNPHCGAFSSYANWRDGKLIRVAEPDRLLSPNADMIHNSFRSHVADIEFPCIGAKAALNDSHYRYGFYDSMNTPEATAGLAHDLWEYVNERLWSETNFATFVACFGSPSVTNEQDWEEMLWAQLQKLHDLDRAHQEWDPEVSRDPDDAHFSFSFAKTGFFIVGLHPASSRIARRFPWPTLVFNTHAQFERLREQNRYQRLQSTIRTRDIKLQGSLNPNLSNFGDMSEARQYSGRAVEEAWKCPFQALMGKAGNVDE